ncbi:MAG: hypothetical protein M3Q22_15925 [Actinomycetota bacterium]|nr:hypothetical protein [Actinomycetota bacterium]MDP9461665.1 hypothetical protein [Actinomycetota bacterium]
MSAHAVVAQAVPATVEATFDLIHDYPRRLDWDTLLAGPRRPAGSPRGRG